jgi:hypothetical protein
LVGQPAAHLLLDALRRRQDDQVLGGVEDQPRGHALDVERPACVTVLAAVGHHGVGLPLALAAGPQVAHGLLQPGQLRGHARQLPAGLVPFTRAPGQFAASPGQQLLLLRQPPAQRLGLSHGGLGALLLGAQPGGGLSQLARHLVASGAEGAGLSHQPLV